MKLILLLYCLLIIIVPNSFDILGQMKLDKYVLSNGGKTVSSEKNNLSITVGQSIIGSSANNLYSNDAGFWYQYEEMIVGIDEKENGLPIIYELHQNYPNPFNPSTTIEYTIPKESYVILVVYDILGREVINLVNEEQRPGNYKIVFDAPGLASGFYIYRLQAGKYIETRKMIYLK